LESSKTASWEKDTSFKKPLASRTLFCMDAEKIPEVGCSLGKTRPLLEWIFADITHHDLGGQASLK
jgi:hypothetical protein